MKTKITILFLFVTFLSFAQHVIKGKVVDVDGNPIPFVNVFLKGTTSGTTTDDNGQFAFNSKRKRGVLEVSFVGYQTKVFQVTGKTRFLNIVLKEESNKLDEVIVVSRPKKRLKKKENPAYKILKEIWKRKQKMGLDLVDAYQYRKHTSIELGLNNLDTVFIRTLFKDQYNTAIKEIKYDSDGVNYYIPIYLSEKISRVYGHNKYKKKREDVKAERVQGLAAQGFVFDRMSNAFVNINVFKNNIKIIQKSFVSPISTDGFATYDYVLYDSIKNGKEKLYNIYFFPIRDEDFAFKGNMWVSDKGYSLKKIKMKVTKNANLNFVRSLSFEKEFNVQNDSIYMPTKNVYEGDFTFLDKNDNNKGLTIKKEVNFDDYVLNQPQPKKFYEFEVTKVRPDQFHKGKEFWDKNNISATNAETLKLIESVKGKRKIKKLTGLINTVASGYINIPGNIQIGPFWTAFASNEIEGFRVKLGFRTFKTKDDRFRLSGFAGYAFKDKKMKYGAEARYLLSYEPRIAVGMAYQNDVEQLGSTLLNTTQLLGRSFGSTVLFSRGKNYFLSSVKKAATNFDYRVKENLHIGFNFTHSSISSATTPDKFSVNYLDENGVEKSSLTDFTSDIYVSYTPGRNVYGYGVDQRFGVNLYPKLVLNYKHGYKGAFNGDFSYDKIQLLYSQPIVLGKLGILDATVEGGKTFGKVPITLLSPIPANQSYSLVRNTFSLLNYYDFITDSYVAGHFEHHFNGFILNRIPLLRKLKLRSLITFRGAYGSISKENVAINKSSIKYSAPNKLYYEYGFGIENIGYGNLRFLRVDAIWRSEYSPIPNGISQPTPKFAIRIGINTGL